MAAADSRPIARAPLRRYVHFRDHTSGELIGSFGTTTQALSLDGAAFNAAGASITEIAGSGYGYLELVAAETAALSILLKCTNDTSDSMDFVETINTEPCEDSGVAQSGTLGDTTNGGTIVLRSGASSVDSFYVGCVIEIVKGQGSGQMRVVRGYVGSSKTISTDRPWLSAGTVPDSTSVYIIHPRHRPLHRGGGAIDVDVQEMYNREVPDSAAIFFNSSVAYGSVNDAGATTTSFIGSSALTATTDFYKNMVLGFTSGPSQGVWRPISAYTSGRLITVSAAFPFAPNNGDTFMIASRLERF